MFKRLKRKLDEVKNEDKFDIGPWRDFDVDGSRGKIDLYSKEDSEPYETMSDSGIVTCECCDIEFKPVDDEKESRKNERRYECHFCERHVFCESCKEGESKCARCSRRICVSCAKDKEKGKTCTNCKTQFCCCYCSLFCKNCGNGWHCNECRVHAVDVEGFDLCMKCKKPTCGKCIVLVCDCLEEKVTHPVICKDCNKIERLRVSCITCKKQLCKHFTTELHFGNICEPCLEERNLKIIKARKVMEILNKRKEVCIIPEIRKKIFEFLYVKPNRPIDK
jgi:hypothetical protein